ncbi:MAG: nucleoside kinase [Lachnospiraceae bacterium]|nr:nucleoside kinase [Lachnospiraceae bacterium]
MAEVTIKIYGEERQWPEGTVYADIAGEYKDRLKGDAALVLENNSIRELTRELKEGAEVSFIDMSRSSGHKAYVRTAILLMVKAIDDVCEHDKSRQVKVEFAIGNGYYISPRGVKIDQAFIDEVFARMKELADLDLPISKTAVPTDEARKLFAENGMMDKNRLFKYRRGSTVNVYELDGYRDYYYGYMLPSTGFVKQFELLPYDEGMVLVLPDTSDPDVLKPWDERKKLYTALKMADQWGSMMGIDSVGDLNDRICEGDLDEIILVQEALQERRIAEIAKEIADRKNVKFVMIAGPSSSGKTTFSHRLSIELASFGFKPHPIGVDDYFKNREDTPRDENGDYNFECLEAIDVELFNKNMVDLLNGKTVELPSFNFKTGKREYKGNYKTLGRDDILVIEGIHGLNDKMSHALPTESKYKIYISALTSLNIDEHNRIPTTDSRLIRRMVRDARTRGSSAQRTIQMWPSVRRGEEENIFPFQESADATFNSALIYELAVLKQFAEPLLYSVPVDSPEYLEAKRLLKFFEYFLGISSERLPFNSIVREFVGGSSFNV